MNNGIWKFPKFDLAVLGMNTKLEFRVIRFLAGLMWITNWILVWFGFYHQRNPTQPNPKVWSNITIPPLHALTLASSSCKLTVFFYNCHCSCTHTPSL